jgi:hypothetical protein
MLSGNRLSSLPQTLSLCTNLELLRLGANNFSTLPDCILQLPRLAWLCFSGNGITAAAEARGLGLRLAPCSWKQLQLHERLGDGASGVTYRATMRAGTSDACECSVAVKVFKRGSVSSDGYPLSEVAACTLAASHSCIIPALHSVADAPDAAPALVMPLIGSVFTTLAAPPSMSTCTRDVYAPSTLS